MGISRIGISQRGYPGRYHARGDRTEEYRAGGCRRGPAPNTRVPVPPAGSCSPGSRYGRPRPPRSAPAPCPASPRRTTSTADPMPGKAISVARHDRLDADTGPPRRDDMYFMNPDTQRTLDSGARWSACTSPQVRPPASTSSRATADPVPDKPPIRRPATRACARRTRRSWASPVHGVAEGRRHPPRGHPRRGRHPGAGAPAGSNWYSSTPPCTPPTGGSACRALDRPGQPADRGRRGFPAPGGGRVHVRRHGRRAHRADGAVPPDPHPHPRPRPGHPAQPDRRPPQGQRAGRLLRPRGPHRHSLLQPGRR